MYDVPGNADTGSRTCIGALINGSIIAGVDNVMKERAVQHHLDMRVRDAKKILQSAHD